MAGKVWCCALQGVSKEVKKMKGLKRREEGPGSDHRRGEKGEKRHEERKECIRRK